MAAAIAMQSCDTYRAGQRSQNSENLNWINPAGYSNGDNFADTMILRSHFMDKNATISEEDIQKILNGTMKLPAKLRVAVVKLENPNKSYRWWNDEDYIKLQQLYIDKFTEQLKKSNRVSSIQVVPGLLAGYSPSINQIREVAVRMQADVAIVFTTQNDIYSRYRLFSAAKFKAFATTQLLAMDIRTGLVPFTEIATRDFFTERTGSDTEREEARNRALREAVQLTISDLGQKLLDWLEREGK